MSLFGYECDRCGACCATSQVVATVADVLREPTIAEHWEPRPAVHEWRSPVFRGCPFFRPASPVQPAACSIYPTRPLACVAFLPGSPECMVARQEHGLAALAVVRREGIAAEIAAEALATGGLYRMTL